MFFRALIAFLALPAVVGGLVPWLFCQTTVGGYRGRSWLPLLSGLVVLLWCVRDFYVVGTLAPWDPPRQLVIIGLYRFTRNPMYVTLGCVLGWSLIAGSPLLLGYVALLATAFHLRVICF